MAAPLLSSFASSKKSLKYVLFADIVIVSVLISIVFVPFHKASQFDIVLNPLFVVKLLTALTLCLHGAVHFLVVSNRRDQKIRISYVLKNIAKGMFLYAVGTVIIHFLAVLFGAAFFEHSAETFHFAMLLAAMTIGTALIHFGLSAETWVRVFIFQNAEHAIETLVLASCVGSVIGAWLGALPIPLDWDRPWQVWPITCVLGTVLGHCSGSILSALYLSRIYFRENKYKHT